MVLGSNACMTLASGCAVGRDTPDLSLEDQVHSGNHHPFNSATAGWYCLMQDTL